MTPLSPAHTIGLFTCPICGGHYWGTSFVRTTRTGKMRLVKRVEDAFGHCNGWYKGDGGYTTCHFAWNRCDDEWVFSPLPD